MSDQPQEPVEAATADDEASRDERRRFLLGLGRWSQAVIGAAVWGGLAAGSPEAQAGAWVNNRGGWINGRGGWINGGGEGGSWVNRRGVRGGSWVNRR